MTSSVGRLADEVDPRASQPRVREALPPADVDDAGTHVAVEPSTVRRVVSLCPSLTESLAATDRTLLVGASDACAWPRDLDVVRVGEPGAPDVDAVVSLAPDLVLAEVGVLDPTTVDGLHGHGLAVWQAAAEDVVGATLAVGRALAGCGLAAPAWLDRCRLAWASAEDGNPATRTAAVVLAGDPWRVAPAGGLVADVLRLLDCEQVDPADAEVVLLADAEAGAGRPADADDVRAHLPGAAGRVVVVDGRHLTWWGPSLEHARASLERALVRGTGPAVPPASPSRRRRAPLPLPSTGPSGDLPDDQRP